MEEKWDLIIEPKRHMFDLKLKQIWFYRDLLVLFVKRDITVVYKQTVLGPLWFFIQPIMTTLIYVFVFGNVANISTDGIPKPLFYMSGIVMWNYFADCFNSTSDTFSANAGLFGKVYFPRLIKPLSLILSKGLKFLIQFTLFIAVYVYFISKGVGVQPQWQIILFPCLLFLMALLGLGMGLIFSSLTTKYKDLNFLLVFMIQLLMYATPIIYPMSTMPAKYQAILWWNPISHIIEAFKFAFIGQGNFSALGLVYSLTFGILVLIFGIIIFNKTEQTFMDTV
jgi:lipopolysaccharide transport system permease protein